MLVLSLCAVLVLAQTRTGGGSFSAASPGPIGSGTPSSGAFTTLTTTGLLTNYDSLPTAGLGVSPILVYQPTTPTTPVGATNIIASATAGLYRIGVYYVVTTAGVGGTSITMNLSYTDAQGAKTDSTTITSTGLALGQVFKTFLPIQQQSVGAISYTITEAGTFTTHPVLALFITAERLN